MFTADISNNVLTSLGSKTIYIPEWGAGSGVTIKSAWVDIGFQDIITATGGNIASFQVQLQLGAAPVSNITDNGLIAHTAENIAGVTGPWDFTNYFAVRYAGPSMACDLSVLFNQTTGTTLGMRNVTAKLYLTYEYDDVATTHLKTIRLPLESLAGAIPTSLTQVGAGNQIPQLTGSGGILDGEASVTIRDYWIEVEGNEANNAGTTSFTLGLALDAESVVSAGAQVAALASDRFCRWIWSRETTVPDTSVSHSVKMQSVGIARVNHAAITVHITYEFAPGTSSAVFNSVLIPFELQSPIGGVVAADASRFRRDIFVEEPSPVLAQSAVRFSFIDQAAIAGLNLRCGSQNFRAYTHIGSVVCGGYVLQQRIDSGSAQGAGFTLARGRNTFTLDVYRTDTVDHGTNLSGVIILNYRSAKHSSGVGVHAHTVMWSLMQMAHVASAQATTAAFAPSLPEANWWAQAVGFFIWMWQGATAAGVSFSAERLSGEGSGDGWAELYTDLYRADAEVGVSPVWVRGRDEFKRYSGDPDPDRMQLQTARKYSFFTAPTSRQGIVMMVTYHAITYTVSGTLQGYTGDGSGVVVDFHRVSNHERVLSLTSVAGGGFSGTWFDNTEALYAQARQSDARVGRSAEGLAS